VRPAVDIGTLTAPEDVGILRKAVKLALALAHEMRVEGWTVMQDYELPSSEEDGVLDEFIRSTAQTEYHYSSTCRMAPENDIRPGVVDDELRVHGVEGIRVADASVFPSILATHTQAPVVAVAEKCADMVKRAHGA
jgi:choline dehydrogenase